MGRAGGGCCIIPPGQAEAEQEEIVARPAAVARRVAEDARRTKIADTQAHHGGKDGHDDTAVWQVGWEGDTNKNQI